MAGGERARLQELVTRLADGDRSAIVPAFAALWPVVRSFALRALPVAADAEDAAQQAITKVFAQAADFDRSRDATAWALTIASFEVRTVRRRALRRREALTDSPPELAARGADPEELLIERDLEAAARDALAHLGSEDAAVVLEAFAVDRRDARAPRTAAFRKRLQRALERLRVVWKAKHEAD